MTFAQFAAFARDFDIFPRVCSKPSLYRIFHLLAQMKEVLQPNPVVASTKRVLKQHSVSVMNPNSQTLTTHQKEETIDKNLFIEAITLCALSHEKDQVLNAALKAYNPQVDEEPSQQLV